MTGIMGVGIGVVIGAAEVVGSGQQLASAFSGSGSARMALTVLAMQRRLLIMLRLLTSLIIIGIAIPMANVAGFGDEMFTIDLIGDREVIAKFEAMPQKVFGGVARALIRIQLDMIAAVMNKLSGPVLKIRTGSLRSSINFSGGVTRFEQSSTSLTATIGTNIKYAKYHEYGVPHEWTIPAKGRALAFPWKGKDPAFFKSVTHKPLPERSFLRSTLKEFEPRIQADIHEAVQESIR